VVIKQSESEVLHGGSDRADRCEDVDPVGVLLDHPVDATGLTLDAAEPGEIALLLRDVAVSYWGGGDARGVHIDGLLTGARRSTPGHAERSRILAVLACGVRPRPRSNGASGATTTVETDMRIAPMLIGSTNPIGARAPAASGTERRL